MYPDDTIVLRLDGLRTEFRIGGTWRAAVDGISLEVRRGETLALVGESGCGKSMTALSVMGLVPTVGRVSGHAYVDGVDIVDLPEREMDKLRGARMAMIFQEPMTSLNPVMTIGAQVSEALLLHRGLSRAEAARKALAVLEEVKIPSAAKRFHDYPHQFSGGMRQRVMIAIALACEPALLLADEPTTALDVTIQAQVLGLLADLRAQHGMAVLFITHNLGVVAQIADRRPGGGDVRRADRGASRGGRNFRPAVASVHAGAVRGDPAHGLGWPGVGGDPRAGSGAGRDAQRLPIRAALPTGAEGLRDAAGSGGGGGGALGAVPCRHRSHGNMKPPS